MNIFQNNRLIVFRFLHNPNSRWSRTYHSVVTVIFIFDSIAFCFYVQPPSIFVGKFHETFQDKVIQLNSFGLAGFLIIEIGFRIWSYGYIVSQSSCARKSWWSYWKQYWFDRSVDCIGIICNLITFILEVTQHRFPVFQNIIQTLDVIQLFQARRILHHAMWTIQQIILNEERHVITFSVFAIFLVTTLSTMLMCLLDTCISNEFEKCEIFETFWLVYLSISTIGYGDVIPRTSLSKIFLCILAAIGIFVFALPANILSTSLSIKGNSECRNSVAYRQSINLIQNTWRIQQYKFEIACSSQNRPFRVSLYCILFALKLKFRLILWRINHSTNDVQDWSQDVEIWQRIEQIDIKLAKLSITSQSCRIKMIKLIQSLEQVSKRK